MTSAQKFALVPIIAVMFTFSFSSAFAAVPWAGETTSKYLTEDTDYLTAGTEGITEAYRAELLVEAGAIETAVKAGTGNYVYYAPEKADALKLVAEYKEAIKAAKTAKEANDLKKKFNGATGTATTPDANSALGAIKKASAVLADAQTATASTTAKVEFTRLVERYGATTNFYLPDYGVIPYGNITTGSEKYFGYSGSPYTVYQILVTSGAEGKFMAEWLMDNDYRTAAEAEAGAKALAAALVPVTDTYKATVKAERDALQDEIYKYLDKADVAIGHSSFGLTVADLEGIDALVKKIKAYDDKGTGYELASEEALKADIRTLAAIYFDKYCTEVSAVPEVKKLTDADKANVLGLYANVNALLDSYADVWKYVGITSGNIGSYACNYAGLTAAYKYFMAKDVEAFGKLEAFTVYEGTATAAYFDASEKNVNALKAKRAAYDALVADYGYADLDDYTTAMNYDDAANEEAKILAAENNLTADAGYEVKDNSKVQAYLNNATVKVTTKALGNKKVRVQATVDTASFEKILDAMDDGFDVSYQFYYKKAANTTYKAGKVKDVNYTTFKLTKGVKYNFQCKVVIKDANGNVVATKDYKASTVGTRTVK